MTSNVQTREKLLTKKEISALNWRSLLGACSCNYERLTHKPFCFMVGPCLKKIYGDDKEAFSEALQRHLVWYNTTPQVYSWFGGLMVALEEQNKTDPDFDVQTINSVKAALMGPMSGIFDSIFLSCFRIIGASIGISMMLEGQAIGMLIYALVYNIPALVCRFYGGHIGYEMGTDLLTRLQKSGLMNIILEGASILGLMVVGGMCYNTVRVNLAYTYGVEGAMTSLQSVIDGIFPGLLKLAVIFLFLNLRKKRVNTTVLVFGTLIVVVVLTLLGIM
ncbi:MAG TPA: PTS system mannose/fructose/sorbose family transporter subunit IID [Erysipelotrichaceae bacterium]|nr:PTS system mannose/fructose/sorbose family transporter subunit IID [Erysipelotrichia bacterium]HPX32485.1 PTS system mannose/fructose/sorbose family transporter subunit IID [Erysipelotrichaceae bacterium]HQA85182.1 PTS system mannose/fructose/sorbose family transporter subunit IID [Erysipelotrichaceae bacterium]